MHIFSKKQERTQKNIAIKTLTRLKKTRKEMLLKTKDVFNIREITRKLRTQVRICKSNLGTYPVEANYVKGLLERLKYKMTEILEQNKYIQILTPPEGKKSKRTAVLKRKVLGTDEHSLNCVSICRRKDIKLPTALDQQIWNMSVWPRDWKYKRDAKNM